MEPYYVLLDGKPEDRADWMPQALVRTVSVSEVKDSTIPLKDLQDRLHTDEWIAVLQDEKEVNESPTLRQQMIDLGPEPVADLDEKHLGDKSLLDGMGLEASDLRGLKQRAERIANRKLVVVFPVEWADDEVGNVLITDMTGEIRQYFSNAPLSENSCPWAFLAIRSTTKPDERSPHEDFIRVLHSALLSPDKVEADKRVADRRIDFVAWQRKQGPVLLSGQTGSGKSYAARQLATGKKLVEVNLAAVTGEQLESRMRGYKAGTFTGADRNGRAGWFEQADGGVLFLDEFQSVSMEAQVQLLDLLSAVSDEVYIARTGEDHVRRRYHVKVVLAVNEDIGTLLSENRLRKDIYYRVRHIERFPSLKDRLERDIGYRYLRALLASYRWKSLRTVEQLSALEDEARDKVTTFFPGFEMNALSVLASREWGGNFRELERVAFDLFYLCDYESKPPVYTDKDIELFVPEMMAGGRGGKKPAADDVMPDTERGKISEIQRALRRRKFNISRALKDQPYYSSREGLRRYLRGKTAMLDEDVLKEPRMVSFLKLGPSKSASGG